MLGVTINYQEAEQFLLKELNAEWVHKPFLDELYIKQYIQAAKLNNNVIVFGDNYSFDDIQRLRDEKKGIISEIRFLFGPCEGYQFILKMASGQIFNIKTFEVNTLELFLKWATQEKDKLKGVYV